MPTVVRLPEDAHTHKTRKPRWSETSVYSGDRYPEEGEGEVALGAWPPSSSCPCASVQKYDDPPECSYCETFRCPRCERWCSWEMGHADCVLCDDCCSMVGSPCEGNT